MRACHFQVRRMCDRCFDILLEKSTDNEWIAKIKQQRFAWHNEHWLRILDMQEVSCTTSGLRVLNVRASCILTLNVRF